MTIDNHPAWSLSILDHLNRQEDDVVKAPGQEPVVVKA